ncbi:MAG: FMN-binding negative transcriptional regulator [Acetobacteraceae bacterium]|nr:FMN-binding negative transcriptional regulator [Acetobacteraceae bacterium]
MYLRPAFLETDLDRMVRLIEAHPFGLLVTLGADGMTASHLPFVVTHSGDTLLLDAHLAAANPQCAAIDGGTALAIFSGPHAYVSPSWYETQPAVPTWDYAAVHVHGTLAPLDPPDDCLHALAAADPARFDHATLPDTFRRGMLAGIRAFRLTGTRTEAQWKMSQNRSVRDRMGVIAALRARGETEVADLIAQTLPAPA